MCYLLVASLAMSRNQIRRKSKLEIALLISYIAKYTSNNLLISDILITQAETHASSFPSSEQYSNKKFVPAGFDNN